MNAEMDLADVMGLCLADAVCAFWNGRRRPLRGLHGCRNTTTALPRPAARAALGTSDTDAVRKAFAHVLDVSKTFL